MKNLSVVAQDLMDVWYRDYQADDQFWDLPFFERTVEDAYNAILQEKYELEKRLQRAEDGALNAIAFDASWLASLELPVGEGESELSLDGKVFSFPFDPYGLGIQAVLPLDGRPAFRTTFQSLWTLKYGGAKGLFVWYVSGQGKVRVENGCAPTRVRIYYVPAPTSADGLADGLAEEAKVRALKFLMLREGIVDQTNDSNANLSMPTESNSEQLK